MSPGKCPAPDGTSTPPSLLDDLVIPPQATDRGITLHLFDQLPSYHPQHPGAYLRISSDHFDHRHEDAEDTRRHLRWGPFARTYRENDTSIDWVVIRPKFRRLLADLAAGGIDGVIFHDLDRLVRQPRDLERPDRHRRVRPAAG